MIKLSLKQNAFHTLRHAIEELAEAGKVDANWTDKKWDSNGDCLEWKRDGKLLIVPVGPLARRPSCYRLKFALLYLIQSCELLLKAYLVENLGAKSILDPKNEQRTINIAKALSLVGSTISGVLTKDEFELLFRANDLRNQIQHHEFSYPQSRMKALCVDFLVICRFLAQKLFGVNVVQELQWDPWNENADPLGDFLSQWADELSPDSRPAADRIAGDWLVRNPGQQTLLCIICGSRSLVLDSGLDTGRCIACGAEGDEQFPKMAEELDDLTSRMVEARAAIERMRREHPDQSI